jgi:eukaryotic-like serine/threonine-protein kinase
VAEPFDALQAALADRYAIEHELGHGGMATVYLAQDLKHGRPVALKVLRPELSAVLGAGAERFLREIRISARLDHPHILTLINSGSDDGFLWYAMPLVRGGSLRQKIFGEVQLALDEALSITRQVASALNYAHAQGVIHRDIKPENILLHEGEAMLSDFGIALAVEEAGGRSLTHTGMVPGTPQYMSPEQAAGERKLDARSDEYSLAVVLYEMLTGTPPHTGATAQAVVAKILTERPTPIRVVRETVPESIDGAVTKALAKAAADRFRDVDEFSQALTVSPAAPSRRWVTRSAIIAAAVVSAALLGTLVLLRIRSAGVSAGPRRLAVLPFENLGDSTDRYFADGMTNEVRGKLSQVPGLEVIARVSSNEYRRTTKTPLQIAGELTADYLLTATVQWEKVPGGPSRVRVTPELIRVEPGAAPISKWQQEFDASLTDVFQVQSDIATKVATALDVALGDSTRHDLAAPPTTNLTAYDAYLKGEAASQSMAAIDAGSLRRAIPLYQQAVMLDSAFVSAWSQLARAAAYLYVSSTPAPEIAAQARQAAERAQQLGPGRPEGYLAAGTYDRFVLRNDDRALVAFQAGLKLAPNDVGLLGQAAASQLTLGHWEAAVQLDTRAATLDPRSAGTAWRAAETLLRLRRYPEAQVAVDRGLALAPTNLILIEQRAEVALAQGNLAGARASVADALMRVDSAVLFAFVATNWDLYWVLTDGQQRQLLTVPVSAFDDDSAQWAIVRAETYALRGNRAQARVYADSARLAYEKQVRNAPIDETRHALRGLALAYLGRKAEAIAEGKRAVTLAPISRTQFIGPYIQHQLVRIYLLVGEPEKALDELEPLLKMPYYLTPGWLKIDPNFDPLRANPRFERLVAGK